jgi:WD40 repeat protein
LTITTLESLDIFETGTQYVVNSLPISQIFLTPTTWSPDGQQIAFLNNGNFQIWGNLATVPIQLMSFPIQVDSEASSWHPTGSIIAISDGESINFWDMTTHEIVKTVSTELTSMGVWSLDWNEQGNKILIADGRFVGIFDYEDESFDTIFDISPFLNRLGEYVNPIAFSVAWSPSEKQIAIGSDSAVRVLDLTDYENQVISLDRVGRIISKNGDKEK